MDFFLEMNPFLVFALSLLFGGGLYALKWQFWDKKKGMTSSQPAPVTNHDAFDDEEPEAEAREVHSNAGLPKAAD